MSGLFGCDTPGFHSFHLSPYRSALILACERGSAEVAELLLSHGADAGTLDSTGHDALHYALRTQDQALWELLQQALDRRRRRGGSVYFSVLASRLSSTGSELAGCTVFELCMLQTNLQFLALLGPLT